MTISACFVFAMARAVGLRMNSDASLRSFSCACFFTSAITWSREYDGFAWVVYSIARCTPSVPRASSLSASLTMSRIWE